MNAEKLKNSTGTPNFLRLAHELGKFKDPYRAADALLAILASRKEAGAA